MVGGGISVWAYGRQRDTKDIDLFIRMSDVDAAMNALVAAGFFTSETEKSWLYKAEKQGVGVDFIVRSTGGYEFDDEVLRRAEWHKIGGYDFKVMGPEDLLIRKIHAWHDGRPDWFDALSVLEATCHRLDWDYLRQHIHSGCVRIASFFLFARGYNCDIRIPWNWMEDLLAVLPRSSEEWETNIECKSVSR